MAQDWTRTNGWGGVGSFSIFSLLTLLSPSHHYANTKVVNSPLTPLFFCSAPGQSQFFSTGREVIQDCQPISIKLKRPKSVSRRLSIWVRPESTFLVLTKGKLDWREEIETYHYRACLHQCPLVQRMRIYDLWEQNKMNTEEKNPRDMHAAALINTSIRNKWWE